MFKSYINYCYTPFYCHEVMKRYDEKGRPGLMGLLSLYMGMAAVGGWSQNVGKEQSNIINDTTQQFANLVIGTLIISMVVFMVAYVSELIIRLPGLLVTNPMNALRMCVPTMQDIREGDLGLPYFVIFWTIIAAFYLSWVGRLDPMLGTLVDMFAAVVNFILH